MYSNIYNLVVFIWLIYSIQHSFSIINIIDNISIFMIVDTDCMAVIHLT